MVYVVCVKPYGIRILFSHVSTCQLTMLKCYIFKYSEGRCHWISFRMNYGDAQYMVKSKTLSVY